MKSTHTPPQPLEAPTRYEIRVRGHLEDRWAASFDGLNVTRRADGTTVLSGEAADQAALHAWLRRIRDLGLPLLSVTRMPAHDGTRPGTPTP